MGTQRQWDTACFALVGFINVQAGFEPGWVLIPDSVSLAVGWVRIALAAVRWFWGPR